MKGLYFLPLLLLFVQSCTEKAEISSIDPVNWEKRAADPNSLDSLLSGSTYLSVYSQIYSETEHKKHNLTATVSIRNVNPTDSIYITRAEYFDTHGQSIRTYFDKPIFLMPMETVEIIIDEHDKGGGTGGNFLFDWSMAEQSNEPVFEAVMISTSGQQGLSFKTNGIKLK